MEAETEIRREGLENLFTALTKYFKTLDKKKMSKLDVTNRQVPLSMLANAMLKHGRFLGESSNYGKSLVEMGEAHDLICIEQMDYVIIKFTLSWQKQRQTTMHKWNHSLMP